MVEHQYLFLTDSIIWVCKSRNIVLNLSKVSDDMDSLGSMAMPETLLTTKAFDKQGPGPKKFQFVIQNDVYRLTHSVTAIHISIC